MPRRLVSVLEGGYNLRAIGPAACAHVAALDARNDLSEEEYREFLRSCPEYERMLVRSGIVLIKYWFSVSDAEQETRFQQRIDDPTKRWKLSPMDMASWARWWDYTAAYAEMFKWTDTAWAPWYVIEADDKRRARLNCISHLLSQIPYEELPHEQVKLPKRNEKDAYDDQAPLEKRRFIPERY